jgi:putative tricarboxylic transport membrane protein
MMETFGNLLMGFSIALSPVNLLFAALGVVLGTIIGALPGIGSVTGVAVLLPITFGMDPTAAIIMLCGIYYGAMYGGTISSVLINTPGDAATVMTTIDGHQMARQGRAGPAFAVSATGSFVAGTFGVLMLTLAGPALAKWGLQFGPPEFFALMVLAILSLAGLAGSSPVKGIIMGALGLMLSTVGLDIVHGTLRFTYGSVQMMNGIDFLPVAIGMFGMGEVLVQMEKMERFDLLETKFRLRDLLPTAQDWVRSRWAIVRGTLIGFVIGVLPGAGATIASFLAYATEKRCSRHPEEFGRGAIEGVAGPESANNAASAGALVPMMTLGIPGSGTTAVLLGAFMMYGLQPGPLLFKNHPDFAWALIASMYIGNIMLVVLNTAFIPTFVSVLRMPQTIMMPGILVLTVVGAYSLSNSMADVWIMIIFGVIGYLVKVYGYPLAPLIIGLVLGPLTEVNLARSLMMSQGSFAIFMERPLSMVLLLASLVAIIIPLARQLMGRQRSHSGVSA